jgi:flagellar M-ring protein FliF
VSDPGLFAFVPAGVRAAFARARDGFRALSRPKRVLLATLAASAVGIAIFFGTRSAFESYVVLFNSLEREDSAAVVAKLKEMKVPYRLQAEGTSIEVPESRVHELRLELAGSGLPRGAGVGFESFDKLRLGATEFEQKVLYRRALEGELARTIGTLGAVQAARVHLVLPEKSVFVSKSEPASASIVVKLRPGRTLGAPEISSVVHLAAASVPGLTADRVALVTAEGAMLHRPKRPKTDGSSDALDDAETPSARALEAALEDRVRGMLEKILGAGHADVRVTAELDSSRVERIEDRYDPSKTALRSEERSVERHDLEMPVAGVPGAESNLPGGTGGGKKTEPGATVREAHTRNFEIDHVVEKRIAGAGALRRLTVAVVVDGAPKTGAANAGAPRSKEELDKLAALVKSAVGADDRRGDVVTVDSMAFVATESTMLAPEAPAPAAGRDARKYVPLAAGALVGVAALAALAAWRRRRAKATKEAKAAEAGDVAALGVGVGDEATALLPGEAHDFRAEALERATRDPATAALVLRGWLDAPAAPAKEAA